MEGWTLEDGEKIIAEIKNIEELVDIVNNIKENNIGQKKIYLLCHPLGQIMHIGISGEIGFLNFRDSSNEPIYYSSVIEDSIKTEDEVVEFYICDNYTEIPLRNCIPFVKIIETIKEFFKTGEMPNTIKWEED